MPKLSPISQLIVVMPVRSWWWVGPRPRAAGSISGVAARERNLPREHKHSRARPELRKAMLAQSAAAARRRIALQNSPVALPDQGTEARHPAAGDRAGRWLFPVM
jgi:hypothetical protein